MKRIALFVLVLITITACTAAPKWVSNPRSVLDYEDYFIGIGSGESYQAALSNAQTDLAQQISVKVESVLELKSLNLEADGKEFYSESIEKSNRITVDQMLKGLTVARQEQEKKTYWVMVTLNKTRMLNSIRGELDALYASAETLFNDGSSMAEQGRVLSAIKNFMDAQAILPEFYAKKTFYDNFAPNPYPVSGKLTISSLESGIRTMLNSILFEVVSGNNQVATKGSQLPESVIFRTIYRNRSGDRIPLAGYPVKVSYGDNTMIEKGQTDNSGQYQVNVIAVPQSGTRGKVMIKSDAFMLPSYMTKSAEQAVGEAFFNTTESEAMVVQLIIRDEKGKRLDRVERNIARGLSSNNVRVSERAPLLMEGVAAVVESKKVDGMGAPKFVVRVTLDLQFAVARTKEVLGTLSGSGQGMSEKSEADATNRAYDNISINNRELAQMINSVSERLTGALLRASTVEDTPVQTSVQVESKPEPTVPVTSNVKDKHWFTSTYRIYAMEDFEDHYRTNLTCRVGRLLSETVKGFKKQGRIVDLDREVELTTDFYYETEPAEINNIKKDDFVFVFHTRKAPVSEREALTQPWQMRKVSSTQTILNGEVEFWAYPKISLDAIRVIKK